MNRGFIKVSLIQLQTALDIYMEWITKTNRNQEQWQCIWWHNCCKINPKISLNTSKFCCSPISIVVSYVVRQAIVGTAQINSSKEKRISAGERERDWLVGKEGRGRRRNTTEEGPNHVVGKEAAIDEDIRDWSGKGGGHWWWSQGNFGRSSHKILIFSSESFAKKLHQYHLDPDLHIILWVLTHEIIWKK